MNETQRHHTGAPPSLKEAIQSLALTTSASIGAHVCTMPGAYKAAAFGEQCLKVLQGKGWGAFTIKSEVRAILPLLPNKRAVVLDVGAHMGLWTRELLATAADRIECIYAFEPSDAHLAQLKQIKWSGLEIVQAAVGKESGRAIMYSNQVGSCLASLHARHDVAQELREDVRIVSLDDFAKEHALDRIDFLKMDIEGHEPFALQGASRLLSERRIRALSFEFGDTNLNSRTFFRDFWDSLSGFGFRVFRIAPGGKLYPITRYCPDLEDFVRVTNYAAVLADTTVSHSSNS